MGFSRRQFLKGSSSLFATLAASGLLRPSLTMAQMPIGNHRNVIFLYLRGGADGLTLCPYQSGPAANAINSVRQNIGVSPGSVILEGAMSTAQNGIPDKVGLHPEWVELRNAGGVNVAANHVNIMKSIGTTTYLGGSHEFKTNIWHNGAHEYSAATAKGWFARLIEHAHMSSFQAWGIGNFGPDVRFAVTEGERPLLLRRLSDFNYQDRYIYYIGSGTGSSDDSRHSKEVAEQLLALRQSSSATEQLFMDNAAQTHDAVPQVISVSNMTTVGSYPGGNFSDQCRDAAKVLLAKRNGTFGSQVQNRPCIMMLERGGWDSHGNQVNSLAGNISDISASLAALITDLLPNANNGFQNIFADTVIIPFSEFGRTTRENGGQGTDHAWATNAPVIGGSVRPGVSGDAPPLSDIYDNNSLTATLPFVSHIKAAISWLNIDPEPIFPELPSGPQLNLFV